MKSSKTQTENSNHESVHITSIINKTISIPSNNQEIERLKSAQKHLELLHGGTGEYICIAKKENDAYSQFMIKYDDLQKKLCNLLNRENIYISQNSFSSKKRSNQYIQNFNALYVDLDYYKNQRFKNFTHEKMDRLIKKEVFSKGKLPLPSIKIKSGGIQYIWLLKNYPNSKNNGFIWRTAEQYFINALKQYGSNLVVQDSVRNLRLAGFAHAGTGETTNIMGKPTGKRYSIEKINKNYKIPIPKENIHTKDRTATSLHRKSPFIKINENRLKDLHRLIELRDFSLIEYHCRKCLLHFMRYLFIITTTTKTKNVSAEESFQYIKQINSTLKEPLPKNELKDTITAVQSARKYLIGCKHMKFKKGEQPGLNFKNETILNMLSISSIEEKKLITITSEDEKKYRINLNNRIKTREKDGFKDGLTMRQRKKQHNINGIIEYIKLGDNQKEIADKMCISPSLISKYMKIINELNEI